MRQSLLPMIACAALTPGLGQGWSGEKPWPHISGPYLGQNPPGLAAEIFAPGIVSTNGSEVNSIFSPELDEFYFTTWTPETGTKILVTRQIGGRWTSPEPAPFSNHPTDVDPAFNQDGTRLYFSTRRPRPGETGDRKSGFDMWFADRHETGWSQEQFMDSAVNSGDSQVYPSVTRDGTLYFQAVRAEGFGKADIYRSRLIGGVYQPPENLGPVINSQNYEGDVFVAPDESYLIVSVYGRDDGFGGADLYISFLEAEGSWSPLKNMGSAVNSAQRDFCPVVSPDGKYLFFSSKRNSEGDIFWVDAGVIDLLKNVDG